MALAQLTDAIRLIEERARNNAGSGSMRLAVSGWPGVDRVFSPQPGLPVGVVHEWFVGDAHSPPLGLLSHLAGRACGGRRACAWIGRACWPYPRRLDAAALAHSLFIDAASQAERLWAVELCIGSRAVAAVVADGRGFGMSATRRLQLAARDSRALMMLARPTRELRDISAAAVRWLVEPVPSPTNHPRWSVELLRCKGLRPTPGGPRKWVMEWHDEAGAVLVPPDVADRPAAAATPASRWKIA